MIKTVVRITAVLLVSSLGLHALAQATDEPGYNIVLGRPTDRGVAISILAESGASAFVEYGEASADSTSYAAQSEIVSSNSGDPILIELDGAQPNTRYYYRVNYSAPDTDSFVSGFEHSFMTQRDENETFHFGVQGDSHPERNNNQMFHPDLYLLTMEQVAQRQPDLYFMLGDDFSIERQIADFKTDNFESGHLFSKAEEGSWPYAKYQQEIEYPFIESEIGEGTSDDPRMAGSGTQLEQRREYLAHMTHSTALFHVNGNHEQTQLVNTGGIFNNAAVWAADARNRYYPLPKPNDFYTGNNVPIVGQNGYPGLAGDGLPRDYYAFTWGDALFVTLDPYWHSPVSPNTPIHNAEPRNQGWKISMGDEQYQWLQETLEGSNAKYKFVFAHHVNGTGRGAAAIIGRQEWGGHSNQGSWEFAENRPTWSKPIHQLMNDAGVTIFFGAHDHVFSREKVDNVVYQSVPNPADNSYWAYNCEAYDPDTIPSFSDPSGEYGSYDPNYGVIKPNAGFLDVVVSPDHVQVNYVRSYRDIDLENNANALFSGDEVNGEVAFSYSIPAQAGDDLAADHAYSCMGKSPPNDHVYFQ